MLPKTSVIGDTADAKYPIYNIGNLKGIRKSSLELLHHAAPYKKVNLMLQPMGRIHP